MTFTELYTTQVDQLEQRIDALKIDIDSVQSTIKAQEQERRFWIDRVAARDAQLREAENEIATTSTVAEIEAIAASMRDLRIDRRASQAKLNLSHKSVSVNQFKLDGLVNTLAQASAQLSETQSDLEDATSIDENHQALKDSVISAPLASIPTDANTLLSNDIDTAISKVRAATSDDFVDLLSERLNHHWDEMNDLQTRIDELNAVDDAKIAIQSGQEGELETKLHEFDSAVSNLSKFVANSEAIVASAAAVANRIQESELLNVAQKTHFDSLMAIGDVVADVLTPESTLRVAEHELLIRIRELETARTIAKAANPEITDTELDDVAEVKVILDGTDGKDAIATMQTDYDAARNAVGEATFDVLIEKEQALQAAQDNLRAETATFVEENPDQDPDTATELDDARDAVSDAQAELDAAQNAMQSSPWYKLEQLEVAIPADTWIDALYLLNAQRQLNQLKAINPTNLADAVTLATSGLVAAIEAQSNTDEGLSISQTLIDQYQEKFNNTASKGTESALHVALGVL